MDFLILTSSATEIRVLNREVGLHTIIGVTIFWLFICRARNKFISESFLSVLKANISRTEAKKYSFLGFISYYLETSISEQVLWRSFEKRTLSQSQE